ncbi:MAG: putative Ig domain-containing protein [Nostocales cyanobacterium LacPavin_0920_SED1_MAG_38_18]|nr:putative Ig domain-containing protein [Nostocales cyanobacterium LacPavin_0920_SED1_MAG_38_18]
MTSDQISIEVNGKVDVFQLSAYGNEQDQDQTDQEGTVKVNGNELELQGSLWRKVKIDHKITPKTILEFEFQGIKEGEIHSIGFDNDNVVYDKNLLNDQTTDDTTFQIWGSQESSFKWNPITNGIDRYATNLGWHKYKILLEDHFNGRFSYLTFGNDQDVTNPTATAKFRGLKIYENPDTPEDPNPGLFEKQLSNTNIYAIKTYGSFIYIAGSTSKNLDGKINNGNNDAFISKYTLEGNFGSTELLGSPGDESARALAINTDGWIYLAGSTISDNSDNSDVFVVQLKADNQVALFRIDGTNKNEYPNAITTGLDGSIYVAGSTGGQLDEQPNIEGNASFVRNISNDEEVTNNEVPTANAIADQNAKQDNVFNFQLPTNTFTDIDADDVLTYSATLENGDALPSWLTFNSTTRTFSGTPTNDNVGSLNIKAIATDKAGATVSDIFVITVENVNDAPTLGNTIADQNAKQDNVFNFQLPTNTFTDIDADDVLTYSATLENGDALPSWLTFNSTTRTFSGTPTNDNVGNLNVKAIATDKAGTSANDIFAIAVEKIIDNQSTTVGTPGDDKLIATPGSQFDGQNNIVFTGAGKDEVDLSTVSVFPNSGNNIVDLGSGEDTIFVNKGDRAFGSDGNDTFNAKDGQGGNRISGGLGDDTFYLGSNDRALGGDGKDIFRVSLGGGNLISGGAGADQFWIVNAELPSSANTVLDFQLGTDVIGIQGAVSLGITTSTLKLNQVGADTAIVFNNQTLATLTGIQASSLSLTDSKQFVFA